MMNSAFSFSWRKSFLACSASSRDWITLQEKLAFVPEPWSVSHLVWVALISSIRSVACLSRATRLPWYLRVQSVKLNPLWPMLVRLGNLTRSTPTLPAWLSVPGLLAALPSLPLPCLQLEKLEGSHQTKNLQKHFLTTSSRLWFKLSENPIKLLRLLHNLLQHLLHLVKAAKNRYSMFFQRLCWFFLQTVTCSVTPRFPAQFPRSLVGCWCCSHPTSCHRPSRSWNIFTIFLEINTFCLSLIPWNHF